MTTKPWLASAAARAVLSLTLSYCLDASPAETQVRHTVIAAAGSAAPSGGDYAAFNKVATNERGLITFDAALNGASDSGVFIREGFTTSAIALGNSAAPDPGSFGFVGSPSLTPCNEVVFSTDTGLFESNGARIRPLVQNGVASPGGGTLTPNAFVTGACDVIAFSADIADDASTTGIFRTDGRTIVAIARDSTLAPTGGIFTLLSGFAINQRREVAFEAVMTGGASDFGVFRVDHNQTKTIFATNRSAPGGGLFGDFSDPVINDRGQVAAVGFSLQNTSSSFGVFLSDGDHAGAIALDGQAAPKGGNYSRGTFAPLVLNDRGQVLFNVGLTDGTSSTGIFRGSAFKTETIALQGTPAPGTTSTFASFQNMKMLDDGRLAFMAQLTFGVGGVDRTNNTGIWVGTSEADIQLLARSGDIIGGNAACVPSSLDQFDLNERGVVWISKCPRSPNASVIFSSLAHDEGKHDE